MYYIYIKCGGVDDIYIYIIHGLRPIYYYLLLFVVVVTIVRIDEVDEDDDQY